MDANNHLLHRATLELSISGASSKKNREITSSFNVFFQERLLLILEEELNNYPSENIIEINKWEIDLGEIDLRKRSINGDDLSKLEKTFRTHIQSELKKRLQKEPNVKQKLAILKEILVTGKSSSQFLIKNEGLFNTFQNLTLKEKKEFFHFLKDHKDSEQIIQRIFYQFTITEINYFLSSISRNYQVYLKEITQSIAQLPFHEDIIEKKIFVNEAQHYWTNKWLKGVKLSEPELLKNSFLKSKGVSKVEQESNEKIIPITEDDLGGFFKENKAENQAGFFPTNFDEAVFLINYIIEIGSIPSNYEHASPEKIKKSFLLLNKQANSTLKFAPPKKSSHLFWKIIDLMNISEIKLISPFFFNSGIQSLDEIHSTLKNAIDFTLISPSIRKPNINLYALLLNIFNGLQEPKIQLNRWLIKELRKRGFKINPELEKIKKYQEENSSFQARKLAEIFKEISVLQKDSNEFDQANNIEPVKKKLSNNEGISPDIEEIEKTFDLSKQFLFDFLDHFFLTGKFPWWAEKNELLSELNLNPDREYTRNELIHEILITTYNTDPTTISKKMENWVGSPKGSNIILFDSNPETRAFILDSLLPAYYKLSITKFLELSLEFVVKKSQEHIYSKDLFAHLLVDILPDIIKNKTGNIKESLTPILIKAADLFGLTLKDYLAILYYESPKLATKLDFNVKELKFLITEIEREENIKSSYRKEEPFLGPKEGNHISEESILYNKVLKDILNFLNKGILHNRRIPTYRQFNEFLKYSVHLKSEESKLLTSVLQEEAVLNLLAKIRRKNQNEEFDVLDLLLVENQKRIDSNILSERALLITYVIKNGSLPIHFKDLSFQGIKDVFSGINKKKSTEISISLPQNPSHLFWRIVDSMSAKEKLKIKQFIGKRDFQIFPSTITEENKTIKNDLKLKKEVDHSTVSSLDLLDFFFSEGKTPWWAARRENVYFLNLPQRPFSEDELVYQLLIKANKNQKSLLKLKMAKWLLSPKSLYRILFHSSEKNKNFILNSIMPKVIGVSFLDFIDFVVQAIKKETKNQINTKNILEDTIPFIIPEVIKNKPKNDGAFLTSLSTVLAKMTGMPSLEFISLLRKNSDIFFKENQTNANKEFDLLLLKINNEEKQRISSSPNKVDSEKITKTSKKGVQWGLALLIPIFQKIADSLNTGELETITNLGIDNLRDFIKLTFYDDSEQSRKLRTSLNTKGISNLLAQIRKYTNTKELDILDFLLVEKEKKKLDQLLSNTNKVDSEKNKKTLEKGIQKLLSPSIPNFQKIADSLNTGELETITNLGIDNLRDFINVTFYDDSEESRELRTSLDTKGISNLLTQIRKYTNTKELDILDFLLVEKEKKKLDLLLSKTTKEEKQRIPASPNKVDFEKNKESLEKRVHKELPPQIPHFQKIADSLNTGELETITNLGIDNLRAFIKITFYDDSEESRELRTSLNTKGISNLLALIRKYNKSKELDILDFLLVEKEKKKLDLLLSKTSKEEKQRIPASPNKVDFEKNKESLEKRVNKELPPQIPHFQKIADFLNTGELETIRKLGIDNLKDFIKLTFYDDSEESRKLRASLDTKGISNLLALIKKYNKSKELDFIDFLLVKNEKKKLSNLKGERPNLILYILKNGSLPSYYSRSSLDRIITLIFSEKFQLFPSQGPLLPKTNAHLFWKIVEKMDLGELNKITNLLFPLEFKTLKKTVSLLQEAKKFLIQGGSSENEEKKLLSQLLKYKAVSPSGKFQLDRNLIAFLNKNGYSIQTSHQRLEEYLKIHQSPSQKRLGDLIKFFDEKYKKVPSEQLPKNPIGNRGLEELEELEAPSEEFLIRDVDISMGFILDLLDHFFREGKTPWWAEREVILETLNITSSNNSDADLIHNILLKTSKINGDLILGKFRDWLKNPKCRSYILFEANIDTRIFILDSLLPKYLDISIPKLIESGIRTLCDQTNAHIYAEGLFEELLVELLPQISLNGPGNGIDTIAALLNKTGHLFGIGLEEFLSILEGEAPKLTNELSIELKDFKNLLSEVGKKSKQTTLPLELNKDKTKKRDNNDAIPSIQFQQIFEDIVQFLKTGIYAGTRSFSYNQFREFLNYTFRLESEESEYLRSLLNEDIINKLIEVIRTNNQDEEIDLLNLLNIEKWGSNSADPPPRGKKLMAYILKNDSLPYYYARSSLELIKSILLKGEQKTSPAEIIPFPTPSSHLFWRIINLMDVKELQEVSKELSLPKFEEIINPFSSLVLALKSGILKHSKENVEKEIYYSLLKSQFERTKENPLLGHTFWNKLDKQGFSVELKENNIKKYLELNNNDQAREVLEQLKKYITEETTKKSKTDRESAKKQTSEMALERIKSISSPELDEGENLSTNFLLDFLDHFFLTGGKYPQWTEKSWILSSLSLTNREYSDEELVLFILNRLKSSSPPTFSNKMKEWLRNTKSQKYILFNGNNDVRISILDGVLPYSFGLTFTEFLGLTFKSLGKPTINQNREGNPYASLIQNILQTYWKSAKPEDFQTVILLEIASFFNLAPVELARRMKTSYPEKLNEKATEGHIPQMDQFFEVWINEKGIEVKPQNTRKDSQLRGEFSEQKIKTNGLEDNPVENGIKENPPKDKLAFYKESIEVIFEIMQFFISNKELPWWSPYESFKDWQYWFNIMFRKNRREFKERFSEIWEEEIVQKTMGKYLSQKGSPEDDQIDFSIENEGINNILEILFTSWKENEKMESPIVDERFFQLFGTDEENFRRIKTASVLSTYDQLLHQKSFDPDEFEKYLIQLKENNPSLDLLESIEELLLYQHKNGKKSHARTIIGNNISEWVGEIFPSEDFSQLIPFWLDDSKLFSLDLDNNLQNILLKIASYVAIKNNQTQVNVILSMIRKSSKRNFEYIDTLISLGNSFEEKEWFEDETNDRLLVELYQCFQQTPAINKELNVIEDLFQPYKYVCLIEEKFPTLYVLSFILLKLKKLSSEESMENVIKVFQEKIHPSLSLFPSIHKYLNLLLQTDLVEDSTVGSIYKKLFTEFKDNQERKDNFTEKSHLGKMSLKALRTDPELLNLIQNIDISSPNQKNSNTFSEEIKPDWITIKEGDRIFVSNAGMVILWPFFSTLFKKLGYTEGKIFKDRKTQERAVNLLQYIIDGEENPPEFILFLNKVICGIPVEEPIPRFIKLTKEEKDEADLFLKTVIGRWEQMKNTSIEVFRDTFLKRDGALLLKDQNWHIKVEKKPIDVLLTKLPWGLSLIKYPWNKYLIIVEWNKKN